MGEIADMLLRGVLCERCGVFLGDEVGYPCYCEDCRSKIPEEKLWMFPPHPNPNKDEEKI